MKTLCYTTMAFLVMLATSCVKDLTQPVTDAKAPTIKATDRVEGRMNDSLRIYGTGYNTNLKKDQVAVNGVNATVLSVTADGTQMTVRIPPRAFNTSNIVVTVDGKSVQGPKFTYLISTGVVSTFAGNGAGGFIDGQGKAATFLHPVALAMDSLGYLYVSDQGNFLIRRIRIKDSTVTTIAGLPGRSGYGDGPGNKAQFGSVEGIAAIGTNVYVSDIFFDTIRELDDAGTNVTTISGAVEKEGRIDGPLSAAEYYDPGTLAVDNSNNLLIVDEGNLFVRKINFSTGQVSSYIDLSHNVSAAAGIAYNPADGDVFVSDDFKHQVFAYSSQGSISTSWGTGGAAGYADGIKGAAVQFNQPEGMAFDDSYDVFVADAGNNCIRMIDSQWNTTTLAGDHNTHGLKDGAGTAAQFNTPKSIVFDKVNHYLYIADYNNNCIRKIVLE